MEYKGYKIIGKQIIHAYMELDDSGYVDGFGEIDRFGEGDNAIDAYVIVENLDDAEIEYSDEYETLEAAKQAIDDLTVIVKV